MALALAADAQMSEQLYFDAVKRFCRSKVVGFEYFRLLAGFDSVSLQDAKPYQFLETDKTKALTAYFELLSSLRPGREKVKYTDADNYDHPELICSSEVETPLGTFKLWLIYPQNHALRY